MTDFTGLGDGDLDELRERLAMIRFTVDGVLDRLGPVAHQALDRNETTPAERATRDGDPLDAAIRLWLLQRTVPYQQLHQALPGLVEPLVAGGYVQRDGDDVRALVDVRPYGDDHHDWWVVADLTPGLDGRRPVVPADHVLGVNSAAATLAELTISEVPSTGSAWDLGSGCGLQSLHLSTQVSRVLATDVNPRALAMTRQTARLNDASVEVQAGNLFDPVPGRRFDLIASNPPFVVSPGADSGLVYRDSGLAGDELCRRLVTAVPEYLTDGGVCQTLANWVHVRGEDWRERVAAWLPEHGCDAWALQREVSDPAAYVEVWLKDAGLHGTAEYTRRYDAWLRWFDELDIEGVGFGWLVLRRTGGTPAIRLEEWPHAVEQPLGPSVDRWLGRVERMRDVDDERLIAMRLRVADGVDQEQVGRPGAGDPEHIVLRQRSGLRRALQVDTAEAGFVGACDGTLTGAEIVGALASLLDEDETALAGRLLPRIRGWIDEGYLEPGAG